MGSIKSKYSIAAEPENQYYFYSQTVYYCRGKRYRKKLEDIPEDLKPSVHNLSVTKLSGNVPPVPTNRTRRGSADESVKHPEAHTALPQSKPKSLLPEINETVTQITTQFDLLDEEHVAKRPLKSLRYNSGDLLQILGKYLAKFSGIPVKLPSSLYKSLTSPFNDFIGIVVVPHKEWQILSNEQKHEEQLLEKNNALLPSVNSQTFGEDGKSSAQGDNVRSARKPSDASTMEKKKKMYRRSVTAATKKGKAKTPSLQGSIKYM